MNVIYLHSHDTGRWISPHGYACPTPNLQRFAEEGVLFRQAFTVAPTCSPSRAALLTGQSAHGAGMLGLAHRGHVLHDFHQHLIHRLKPMGYHTALCGQQHIANHVGIERIGYDEVCDVGSNSVKDVAPAAETFLRDPARRDQPFFLACGFFETHHPWPEADPQEARYVKPPDPLPDTPQTRLDTARYHRSVATLDEGIGRVLRALDDASLSDDTLVIITTDHGPPVPEMKCNLTDHGTGVMLMMRGPASSGFVGGKVVDAMVSHLDVYPTVCELAGAEKPDWLEGESLVRLVRGEVDRLHDEIFAEVTYHAGFEPMRSVRTERHLYIRRFDEKWSRPCMANIDRSHSKTLWEELGHATRELPREALYDNVLDPQQRRNLADDPEHAATLADLRGRLEAWMQRTDDPLLTDPLPVPRTLRVNLHTAADPGFDSIFELEPGAALPYPET